MGRATAGRGTARGWERGGRGPAALKTQAGPPEPPVRTPVGGAASADPQAPARRLLAALNKIRGERLGPSEHMALPTTERAEEAPEAPIDPKRGPRHAERPTRVSQVGSSA